MKHSPHQVALPDLCPLVNFSQVCIDPCTSPVVNRRDQPESVTLPDGLRIARQDLVHFEHKSIDLCLATAENRHCTSERLLQRAIKDSIVPQEPLAVVRGVCIIHIRQNGGFVAGLVHHPDVGTSRQNRFRLANRAVGTLQGPDGAVKTP